MKIERWIVAASIVGAAALAAAGGEWKKASSADTWAFPRDHYAHHDYAIEWWYFTGLLADDASGERFGYQFTFFRIGLAPDAPRGASRWNARAAIMGHAAIGRIGAREHRFSDVFHRASPLLGAFETSPSSRIAWCVGPPGTDFVWGLRRDGDGFAFAASDDARGFAFRLAAAPTKPMTFHGQDGFSRKNADGSSASRYYSFTRMATSGDVTLDGRTFHVTGSSWMDHEFSSSQLDEAQVGWDWFSLQLDHGRELMLYVLRRADGSRDYASGTLVLADGRSVALDPARWTIDVLERWKSDATGATYPARWRLVVPEAGLDVEVEPLFAEQENRSALFEHLHYWEGAVRVTRDGEGVGAGYVELTGYGENARLPL